MKPTAGFVCYHAGGGACRMRTDVGVPDESASPLLPAARLINQSQPNMVQPVRIDVLYTGHTMTTALFSLLHKARVS